MDALLIKHLISMSDMFQNDQDGLDGASEFVAQRKMKFSIVVLQR
jgi:hypothetical protein